jgi:hypothetical protein
MRRGRRHREEALWRVGEGIDVDQIIAAVILAGGAYFGVWKGAVYAVNRLSAQLGEERALSEERLDAESDRLQMQLDAERRGSDASSHTTAGCARSRSSAD